MNIALGEAVLSTVIYSSEIVKVVDSGLVHLLVLNRVSQPGL